MDLSSIIGVVAGLVLVIFVGIGPSKIMNFWDPQSIAIVLGGTLAAVIASYPFSMLKNVVKHAKILVQGKRYNTGTLIDTLVDMAQLARKNGLLALEERTNDIDDVFFKQGIMLIVDATEPEEVRTMLENEVDATCQRHEESAAIYEKASSYAPAFGMVGTLVGLINMLKAMNMEAGGADDLGPAMSTALVTTFYGSLLANLFFLPLAKKLRVRNEEELLYRQIMIEGILAIQSGDNPKFLKEKLLTFLAQKDREKIAGSEGGEGDQKPKKEKKSKKK